MDSVSRRSAVSQSRRSDALPKGSRPSSATRRVNPRQDQPLVLGFGGPWGRRGGGEAETQARKPVSAVGGP
eukprot:3545235-Pyramimonas_sp.AAC.1